MSNYQIKKINDIYIYNLSKRQKIQYLIKYQFSFSNMIFNSESKNRSAA